jgi:protein-S-isoprenylcysteine O-methyltransferase Ste14
MITTVLAAADPATMINNAVALVRNVGVSIIVLMGSGHLIAKTAGHQFTIGVLSRTAVICCAAVALFLLLPTLAEMVTGTAGRVTGTNLGVR